MLKNDTLKNGKSRIGLYESAPPPGGLGDGGKGKVALLNCKRFAN